VTIFSLCIQIWSNTVLSIHYVKFVFSAKFDSLVLKMHKTLATDWLTCVQIILQASFVGLFDVVRPSHLPTMRIL